MHSRIAILGAGPAGLTLAGLLRRSNISCTIFEKDPSKSWADGRSGSGTLDLHAGGGLLAVDKLGLMNQFNALARYNASFRVADAKGNVHLDIEGGDNNEKPEIDRRDLRDLLLTAVGPADVQWGSKVHSVERTRMGAMAVRFADGTVQSGFSLVIGADGAWSKITTEKPVYQGVTFVTCWMRKENPHYATAASLASDGLYVALGDDKGIVIAKLRDGTYQVGAMLRVSESWTAEHKDVLSDIETLRQELCHRFEDWSEPLKTLMENVEGTAHPWTQYSMPIEGLQWECVPGVTLIGDAAHLTASGGHGVNAAMFDAHELSGRIVARGIDNLEVAVEEYEREMLPRAKAAVEAANNALRHMISPKAPSSWLRALMGEEAN